ncbi:MAG: response regulator [Magnetococcales bacterium]|nr:response regulator [Magnetococcales bacterium]
MNEKINHRVLVIDDDKELLDVYRETFHPNRKNKQSSLMVFAEEASEIDTEVSEESIFKVSTASQGEEGVELVRRSLTNNQPFAVAFIDIRMPPGIDGLETAKRIRELDERIYVIIVTAYSDHSVDEIQEALQHDVLLARKPLSKDEILQQARNACNRWQEDESLRCEGQEIKERTGQLELNNKLLTDIISAIPEVVLICSPRGRIRYINHAGIKMVGYSPTQLQDKLIDLIFPVSKMQNLLIKIVEQNLKPRHISRMLRNSKGEDKTVFVSGSVLSDATGDMQLVLLVLNDFTEFWQHTRKVRQERYSND